MSSARFLTMMGEVEFGQQLARVGDDVRSVAADLAKVSGILLAACDRQVAVVDGVLGKAASADWSGARSRLAIIHDQLQRSAN